MSHHCTKVVLQTGQVKRRVPDGGEVCTFTLEISFSIIEVKHWEWCHYNPYNLVYYVLIKVDYTIEKKIIIIKLVIIAVVHHKLHYAVTLYLQ